MNQLMLAVFALVAFTYFGGSKVPSVLRENKEILLGVLIGCLIGCVLGSGGMMSMEGFKLSDIAAPFEGGQGRPDQGRNPPA